MPLNPQIICDVAQRESRRTDHSSAIIVQVLASTTEILLIQWYRDSAKVIMGSDRRILATCASTIGQRAQPTLRRIRFRPHRPRKTLL